MYEIVMTTWYQETPGQEYEEVYMNKGFEDMESYTIHRKNSEKRNRRIDIVLGLLVDDKYTPTIGDLYPNLK